MYKDRSIIINNSIPGGKIPIYPNNFIIRFSDISMITITLNPKIEIDYYPRDKIKIPKFLRGYKNECKRFY